ncbi:MAG: hypothetical protein UW31_C0006G0072 [Candidatus Collierbacteria bacterium GW2011_GWA2_44_13]|nr:MAG: hypothetical protein UW31_C0006G0072 [Candidatus Collierbacteria bacterium GW2011_GWA2_44_13]
MFTPEGIFTAEPLSESVISVHNPREYESLGYTRTEKVNLSNEFCDEWKLKSETMRIENKIPPEITITTLEKDGSIFLALEISPTLTIIVSHQISTSHQFPAVYTEISHILYGTENKTLDILSILKSNNDKKPLLSFYGFGQFDPNSSTASTPLLNEKNRSDNFVYRALHELAHESLSPHHHSYRGITKLTTAQKEREVNAYVLQSIRKLSCQTQSPIDANSQASDAARKSYKQDT